ncbi:MAG: hypothetical protein MUP85_10540, partial [Candidatus Lokiarchaeota archaeon]|nr:hypothetical protein [Candidatus Lokiarchaeota archaeon]
MLNDNSDKKEENNSNEVNQNTERSIEEISESAEKLTKEANILVKIEEFDESLEKYDKAIDLYRQTNNNSEIEKVFELIELCYDEKSRFLRKAIKDEFEERLKSKLETYGTIQATDNKEQERIQRLMKLEREKEKEETFKNTILQIARDAEKMEREYENAIKRGKFEEQPPFEKILQMYEDILNMLRDKGWTDQLSVYKNQIKIIQGKATKDKKLREIEAKKEEKEEEYLKSMKLSERKKGKPQEIAAAHEKVRKVEEDTLLQQNIDKIVSEAKALEREYSLAIKKGDFNREPPFEKIIEIYQSVKAMFLERNW